MTGWHDTFTVLAVRLHDTGDVVMRGPALRAVKVASTEANITVLGNTAGVRAAPSLPWIDDAIEWRPVWQDVGGKTPLDPQRELELVGLLTERTVFAVQRLCPDRAASHAERWEAAGD